MRCVLIVAATILTGTGAGTVVAADAASAEHVNVSIPEHQSVTLPNGLKLILLPRHEIPLIAFNMVLRGGSQLDPPGRDGTASLTAALLTHGAGTRDAHAFADAVEGVGGNIDVAARNEAIQVQGQFLSRDSHLMLQLLADAVLRPRFDAGEFEKLRTRSIEELKASKDSSPSSVLGSYGRALLFAGHPYGRAVEGSERSLARTTRDDITRFYAAQSGADRATLVIAGDIDVEQIRNDVTAIFGGWRRAPEPLPALAATARITGRRVLLVDAPGSAQTYFWIANVGVPRRYPERAALNMANLGFGGSLGSMLNQELRIKSGLTYDASSRFARGGVAGEFAISSFTQTANTGRAVDLALSTLGKLKQQGLSEEAISSARNFMLGQYPLAFETTADWASALGDLDLYGLPESYISQFGTDLLKVDAAAIRAVIDTAFPSPDNVDIVLIGDAAKISDVAAKLGPVTRMSLAAPDFAPAQATH